MSVEEPASIASFSLKKAAQTCSNLIGTEETIQLEFAVDNEKNARDMRSVAKCLIYQLIGSTLCVPCIWPCILPNVCYLKDHAEDIAFARFFFTDKALYHIVDPDRTENFSESVPTECMAPPVYLRSPVMDNTRIPLNELGTAQLMNHMRPWGNLLSTTSCCLSLRPASESGTLYVPTVHPEMSLVVPARRVSHNISFIRSDGCQIGNVSNVDQVIALIQFVATSTANKQTIDWDSVRSEFKTLV